MMDIAKIEKDVLNCISQEDRSVKHIASMTGIRIGRVKIAIRNLKKKNKIMVITPSICRVMGVKRYGVRK